MHDTRGRAFTEINDLTTARARNHDGERAERLPPHPLGSGRTSPARARRTRSTRCTTPRAPPRANGQPTAWTTWSAHTDNVAYDVETGHFEPPDARDRPQPTTRGRAVLRPGRSSRAAWARTRTSTAIRTTPTGRTGPRAFPTPNYLSSPRRAPGGQGTYPVVRFETDLPRIEEANNGGTLTCDHHTGAGCTNPPPGAFYPWYHLLQPAQRTERAHGR